MSDDRLRELESAVAAQATEITILRSQLSEHKQKAEMLEAQKALAQKDLEIHLLKEGGGRGEHKALELERRDAAIETKSATIEALKAKHKLLQKEFKEFKKKVAESGAVDDRANDDEEEDGVDAAVEIGQRKHVNLKKIDRLCLVMWKAPAPMHAVHFNQLGTFVKASSFLAIDQEEEDDEYDEERTRKRRRPENREWLGLLELEAPMAFDEVGRLLKRLGQNDVLFGPVFVQSEQQVWQKVKGSYQPGRVSVRLSLLRSIAVDDNFMRQSKKVISDFIVSQKDRHFSSDDSWLYLSKVMN